MPGGSPDRLACPYRLSPSSHGDTCAARVARAFGDTRGFLARGGSDAASGDLRPGHFFCRRTNARGHRAPRDLGVAQAQSGERHPADRSGDLSFPMLGQEFELPQSLARLTLPLTIPAGSGCVRIGVDAQGNPVAVVVARRPYFAGGDTRPVAAKYEHERRPPNAIARYHRDGRARRGASGALYPQSAPAGLNSLPRSGIAVAACVAWR